MPLEEVAALRLYYFGLLDCGETRDQVDLYAGCFPAPRTILESNAAFSKKPRFLGIQNSSLSIKRQAIKAGYDPVFVFEDFTARVYPHTLNPQIFNSPISLLDEMG